MAFESNQFDQLATTTFPFLRSIASRYLKPRFYGDLDDVVQTTLGIVWQQREEIKGRLRAYAIQILKRTAIKWCGNIAPPRDYRTAQPLDVGIEYVGAWLTDPSENILDELCRAADGNMEDIEALVRTLSPSKQRIYEEWRAKGFNVPSKESPRQHADQLKISDLKAALLRKTQGTVPIKPHMEKSTFDPSDPLKTLTSREQEVILALLQGHEQKRIAGLLSLSPKTVGTYKLAAFHKLGLVSMIDLALFGIRQKLIQA